MLRVKIYNEDTNTYNQTGTTCIKPKLQSMKGEIDINTLAVEKLNIPLNKG